MSLQAMGVSRMCVVLDRARCDMSWFRRNISRRPGPMPINVTIAAWLNPRENATAIDLSL